MNQGAVWFVCPCREDYDIGDRLVSVSRWYCNHHFNVVEELNKMKANIVIDPNVVIDPNAEEEEEVDLIASGYEAMCPRCETLCELIEVPRSNDVVECPKC